MGNPSTELSDFVVSTLPVLMAHVKELLRPGELERVSIWSDGEGGFRLEVVAVGEVMTTLIFSDRFSESEERLGERFRSDLQDWVAESRFGWGQLRGGGAEPA
ncbi:hypothetical protein KPL76_00075 [Subtercola sp. PAMC28395]|uniref:hypothetical protein n=1 Tax=Subtercola sp. PAMC28395 TaxID=2846775 RepID=UPI001C0DCD72|nr:hypothetical protein [Subtercola sp. PAMC28395]QWT23894.1 hypothetical protein KPL76_00075 [Subtercola sp. PAMC28395]